MTTARDKSPSLTIIQAHNEGTKNALITPHAKMILFWFMENKKKERRMKGAMFLQSIYV